MFKLFFNKDNLIFFCLIFTLIIIQDHVSYGPKDYKRISRQVSSLLPVADCLTTLKSVMYPDVPAPSNEVFGKVIKHPKLYLWDNWGYEKDGVMHVYSLAASRKYNLRERHFHVHWRHFTSTDGGQTWIDEGAVLTPRRGKGTFDSKSIWSGSVRPLKNGDILAAYTGLDEKGEFLQSLGLAISRDGYDFKRLNPDKPFLSHEIHRDELLSKGYYVDSLNHLGSREGEVNNSIQALRDPYIFEDSDGIHIFWSAKSYQRNGNGDEVVASAIGHLVIEDLNSLEVKILEPVVPPDGHLYTQLELPNVYKGKDDKYYWFIGTTNRQSEDQAENETEMRVRMFVSNNLYDLKSIGNDSSVIINSDKAGVYGMNIIQKEGQRAENLDFRLFSLSEDADDLLSLPPTQNIDLKSLEISSP